MPPWVDPSILSMIALILLPTRPAVIGLHNYRVMLHDPEVRQAALTTAVIAVVGTVAINLAGLGAALALSAPGRVHTLLRTVFFYPYVVSALVIGFLWSALLSTNGAVNTVLETLGHSGLPFLSMPGWALASLITVIVWSDTSGAPASAPAVPPRGSGPRGRSTCAPWPAPPASGTSASTASSTTTCSSTGGSRSAPPS